MNGLTGARRLASPVRLTLARQLGADIDGAWWPHTASVASELPELVEVLHPALGEVVDIRVNWSAAQGQLDLDSIVTGTRGPTGTKLSRPRLMMVAGRRQSVKLLVVPCRTSVSLGSLVMRRAAAMPVEETERRTSAYETADRVLRVAQLESARWLGRLQDPTEATV
ncbi:DUF5994 family protein [Mycolicibacterium setense]|uniref:Uncharacterized protein n=1 Tax=Mycolicibacterium setense TaxID=431269 RepID=A0ABR4Z223_9MYCO|nr:DUF5994 family protein [Mycolicibacterium setense]KHO24745.1 hypothetical protein QQ25_03045 [Mycolicibacterium setense]KHO28240.1 hypothetical protein QQ44_01495 [Mycolicibacterium setense]MCV7110036.1 hypothetical protein [Mycolicibacterium setense]OBB20826.1 hypothetical protein A5761_04870 [Mycolicibacterium setense]